MPYRLVVDSIVIQRVVKYICSIRNEHGFHSLFKTKKIAFHHTEITSKVPLR